MFREYLLGESFTGGIDMWQRIGYICIIVLLCLGAQCRSASDGAVRIKGSTTLAPVMAQVADVFKQKNINVVVESNGSHNGIYALIEGRCNIAESSTQISDRERDFAAAKGIVLREHLVAYDIVVPIVHPKNNIRDISLETLRKVFSGVITKWSEIGGENREIHIVVRDENSGTRDVWDRAVVSSKGVARVSAKGSNSAVLAEIAHDEDAIGYVSYSFLNSEVKALSIDGIAPVPDARKRSRYPIFRPLFLYVDESRIPPSVREFMIFLFTVEGKKILRQKGFIPADDMK